VTAIAIGVAPVRGSVGDGEIEFARTPEARMTWLSSRSKFGMSVVIGIAFDNL